MREGVREPYLQFIERLQDARKKQIVNVEARNHLILQLSKDNASEDCHENPSLNELFQCFPHNSLNIVTDSAYVADITQILE